ncbi:MAG: type I 3-dehydroquinate dehydratase, partial [Firmicutes bacterium]|nr:type I 3-dehydroquinate dehydratase [Bacillota bacterium]
SAVTFGALGKASAPGQIPVEQLKEVLQLVDSLQ